MTSPVLSALSTAFIAGGSVFGKAVLDWDIKGAGIEVRTNVKGPQALVKLTMGDTPRPYRSDDDFSAATFTDRVLTAYQSKYDFNYDAENERNTYLAELPEAPFSDWAVQQAAKQYLDAIVTNTLWLGVRNSSGSTAVGICNGWGTIIAAEITATNLTPVTTATLTSSNTIAAVQSVVANLPIWAKKKGGKVLVSFSTFELYAANYATLFGFQFMPNQFNKYRVNNTNFELVACDFMGTSSRIVATMDSNLVYGTDAEAISIYSTPHLNLLQNRMMKTAGCQIKDLAALSVNNLA